MAATKKKAAPKAPAKPEARTVEVKGWKAWTLAGYAAGAMIHTTIVLVQLALAQFTTAV